MNVFWTIVWWGAAWCFIGFLLALGPLLKDISRRYPKV